MIFLDFIPLIVVDHKLIAGKSVMHKQNNLMRPRPHRLFYSIENLCNG